MGELHGGEQGLDRGGVPSVMVRWDVDGDGKQRATLQLAVGSNSRDTEARNRRATMVCSSGTTAEHLRRVKHRKGEELGYGRVRCEGGGLSVAIYRRGRESRDLPGSSWLPSMASALMEGGNGGGKPLS